MPEAVGHSIRLQIPDQEPPPSLLRTVLHVLGRLAISVVAVGGLVSVDDDSGPPARNRDVVEVRARDGRLWDVVEPASKAAEELQSLLEEMREAATHMSRVEFAEHYGLRPWPE